eukprot:GHVO01007669.1.p2 GENE.GHVO01007669.1~~GHVO01007669.1.p2  ORF type:complete len:129 (+),score=10.45 GHVO01007669.1:52-387(+)
MDTHGHGSSDVVSLQRDAFEASAEFKTARANFGASETRGPFRKFLKMPLDAQASMARLSCVWMNVGIGCAKQDNDFLCTIVNVNSSVKVSTFHPIVRTLDIRWAHHFRHQN